MIPLAKRRTSSLSGPQARALISRLRDRGVPRAWLLRNGTDLIAAGRSRRFVANALKQILKQQGALPDDVV